MGNAAELLVHKNDGAGIIAKQSVLTEQNIRRYGLEKYRNEPKDHLSYRIRQAIRKEENLKKPKTKLTVAHRGKPTQESEKKDFFKDVEELIRMHRECMENFYSVNHPVFEEISALFIKIGELESRHKFVSLEELLKGGMS
jgi:hypothetical protein